LSCPLATLTIAGFSPVLFYAEYVRAAYKIVPPMMAPKMAKITTSPPPLPSLSHNTKDQPVLLVKTKKRRVTSDKAPPSMADSSAICAPRGQLNGFIFHHLRNVGRLVCEGFICVFAPDRHDDAVATFFLAVATCKRKSPAGDGWWSTPPRQLALAIARKTFLRQHRQMAPDLSQIIDYLARRRAEGKIIHLSPYTAGKIEEALRAYAYPPPAKVDRITGSLIYGLDEWTPDAARVVKTHALLGDWEVATAAWMRLIEVNPFDRLTWRHDALVHAERLASDRFEPVTQISSTSTERR